MTILEPGFTMNITDAMFIRQIRTIGLGILEDDGSGWSEDRIELVFMAQFGFSKIC